MHCGWHFWLDIRSRICVEIPDWWPLSNQNIKWNHWKNESIDYIFKFEICPVHTHLKCSKRFMKRNIMVEGYCPVVPGVLVQKIELLPSTGRKLRHSEQRFYWLHCSLYIALYQAYTKIGRTFNQLSAI